MEYFNLFFIVILILNVESLKNKNIVLILTDDQDIHLNSVEHMLNVQQLIANEGASFENAYTTTPICCPSRSSILTGLYSHNHQAINNSLSGGCSSSNWQKLFEPLTFGNSLHSAGYTTFYAGKYLNQYGDRAVGGAAHVPPGWDWWYGLLGNSRYYNYNLSINGTEKFFANDYLTDVIANYSSEFLKQRPIDKPFLMVLSTPAPHAPFTPADRHKNSLPDVEAVITPAFNYSNLNNKHWLLRMSPIPLPTESKPILDSVQRNRLRTLLAVDELVKSIIDQLEQSKIINDTYVIYTSDNGYHIGQFCQFWDKRQPYETDISVPLFIRGPNIRPKSIISNPVANIDFAPTIIEMAGLNILHNYDGVSFFDILNNPSKHIKYNRTLFIEYSGEGNPNTISNNCPWKYDTELSQCSEDAWCKCQDARNNSYSCVRHFSDEDNILLCNFDDDENFIEIYNLEDDKHQLRNLARNQPNLITKFQLFLETLKQCSGITCYL
ncbi:N-acetylglucosamine-6-sulfatase-like [Chrysoperla carnea]|uniref:N-acetylglucosamine-6-sulfatase-like n=1 Tax=Chrysoperla carnea TaxID=189513 RepID=UPI001D0731DE|nr:N-acetylglucosamine-6-sulfatase-like [Chrysoperla carnea]